MEDINTIYYKAQDGTVENNPLSDYPKAEQRLMSQPYITGHTLEWAETVDLTIGSAVLQMVDSDHLGSITSRIKDIVLRVHNSNNLEITYSDPSRSQLTKIDIFSVPVDKVPRINTMILDAIEDYLNK